jgi:hypothetical protein
VQFKYEMKLKEEGESSSNQFIKLKDQEVVKGVFRGDPYEFKQHWLDGEKKSLNCQGAKCPECAKGNKPKFRFRINFIYREDQNSPYVAKIFEHGYVFYKALKDLHEGGYNLENHTMAVKRHGEGTQTTYSIVPTPNGAIGEQLEKTLRSVKLNDLSLTKADSKEFDEMDDIPF